MKSKNLPQRKTTDDLAPRLSPQECAFVHAIVAGHLPGAAAVKAGYSYVYGTTLLRRPDIARAVQEDAQRVLVAELIPLAHNVIREILHPRSGASALVRAKVAVGVVSLGIRAQRNETLQQTNELSSLTLDQLRDIEASLAQAVDHARGVIDANYTEVLTESGSGLPPGGELETVKHEEPLTCFTDSPFL